MHLARGFRNQPSILSISLEEVPELLNSILDLIEYDSDLEENTGKGILDEEDYRFLSRFSDSIVIVMGHYSNIELEEKDVAQLLRIQEHYKSLV